MYEYFCGLNINLQKWTLYVGCFDLFQIVVMTIVTVTLFTHGFYLKSEEAILILMLAIGIACAIFLIHGAMKLNKKFVIIWLVSSALRILLTLVFVIQILIEMIFMKEFEFSMRDPYLYIEALDFVLDVLGWIIAYKFYHYLKQRDENNFRILEEDA